MKQIKLLMVAFLAMIGSSAYAADYIIDQRFTSIAEATGKTFFLVDESASKAFYSSGAQNLGYGSYVETMSSDAHLFQLEYVTAKEFYLLQVRKNDGTPYTGWTSDQWYFNSQTATNWCSFILGLSGQYGQDGENLAAWTIEEKDGKFALKNVGTGKYLKDAAPAKYDDPTYFTFCTLKLDLSSLKKDYDALKAKVLAINAGIDVSAADALADAAASEEDYANANAALITALRNYLPSSEGDIDVTSFLLVNPSFEDNFTGWTQSGMARQTNTSFGKTGAAYAEAWQPNGTKSVSQTLKAMPQGTYTISVKIKARGITSAKVFANGKEQPVTIADAENVYTVVYVCEDGEDITFGAEGVGTGAGNSWFALDNFTMKYNSALPELELTPATGKMNQTIAEAQETAIATYNADKTVANYKAVLTAIEAAQNSVATYAEIAAWNDKADKNLNDAGKAAYATILDAYNNGTATESASAKDLYVAQLKAGNVIEGAEVTIAWLVNPDFEVPANNGAMPTGWTITITGQNCGQQNRTDTNSETGLSIKNFIEAWHPSALGPGVIAQTVSDLPEGTYRLECDASVCHDPANGDGSDITGAYIFIKSNLKTEQEPVGTARLGIKHFSVSFSHGGSGEVQFGLMATNEINANWLSADNFKIYYVGGVDLSIYENALADAVAAAKAIQDTPMNATVLADLQAAIATNEGATYSSSAEYNDAINAMNAAIDAANASIADYAATKTAFDTYAAKVAALSAAAQAAYDVSAIQSAYDTRTLNEDATAKIAAAYIPAVTIDAVPGDMTDKIVNPSFETGNYNGWTIVGSNDTGAKDNSNETYTMSNVDGTYVFNTWSTGNPISQVLADMPTGLYKLTAVMGTDADKTFELKAGDAIGTATSADKGTGVEVSVEFEFAGGNMTISAGTADKFWYKVDNFRLEYRGTSSTTLAVSAAAGYATFVAPFDVEVPDGVKASKATGVDAESSNLVLEAVEGTIPANTPVILASASDVSVKVYGKAVDGTPKAGLLTGVYEDTPAPAGSYVLQNQTDGVKFYLVGATVPTVKAGHAYLTIEGAGVKAIGFGGATAINGVEVAKAQNGAIFNLAGQQLNGLQKGINIVNGKKVLVK